MNLFQILAVNPCEDLGVLVSAVRTIFTLIQWLIPLTLIVLCTIDMFKAMTSGDEKKTKEAKDTSIRRLIYAFVAFMIPFIVSLAFKFAGNLFNDNSASNMFTQFMDCWDGTYHASTGNQNEVGLCVKGSNSFETTRAECDSINGNFYEKSN